MIKFIPAKINIGLYITGELPNGYHSLLTTFYPIGISTGTTAFPSPFGDILELVPSADGTDGLVSLGNPIDCEPEKNLVMKALRLFRAEARKRGIETGAMRVILEKHIPDGAGLGGGSADATCTLLMLNGMHGGIFNTGELVAIATRLGADCPFFVEARPVVASGIGEVMTPLPLSLKGKWIAVVKPDYGISTAQAFAGVENTEAPAYFPGILSRSPEEWRGKVKNMFEDSFFMLHPEAKAIKETLYEYGASYTSLSGSGSAFFGIFSSREEACNAAGRCGTAFRAVLPAEF